MGNYNYFSGNCMLFCFALLQNIKEYKGFIKPKASPGMTKAMNLPFFLKKKKQLSRTANILAMQ